MEGEAEQQAPEAHGTPDAQRFPQVPQFCSSVWRSLQTALVPVPQTTSPVGQAHRPALQVAPAAQRVPHAPQFCSSVCQFTQVSVAGHASGSAGGHWQTPDAQTSFVNRQTFPQPPQLAGSVAVATHAKLLPTGQGTRGATHWQTPDAHVALVGHPLRQVPQFPVLLERSTHCSPGPVQTVASGSQTHAPAEQVPSPQNWRQEPQWSGSFWRSTQAPPQGSCPAGHWH
jgi:hypothetical protein